MLIRYPWKDWFGRKSFRLRHGKEYDCMPHSMSVQVRNAARRFNKRVKVRIEGTTLLVDVLGRRKAA